MNVDREEDQRKNLGLSNVLVVMMNRRRKSKDDRKVVEN